MFSTTFVWIILILRGNERDTIKMSIGLHVKCLLFLSDFNKTLSFFDRFSKSTEISNLMKIRPVGAELFHADRVTDRHDEANSRFVFAILRTRQKGRFLSTRTKNCIQTLPESLVSIISDAFGASYCYLRFTLCILLLRDGSAAVCLCFAYRPISAWYFPIWYHLRIIVKEWNVHEA